MTDADFLNRMDSFESRLVQLEELLGVRQPISQREPDSATRKQSPHIAAVNPEELLELLPEDLSQINGPVPPIPAATPLQVPAVMPVKQSDLEQTIGLRWAGWVGAVVLVIGAGLGIKFGYDQGWFQIVPPIVRLALLAFTGIGLIAIGEWVYRKVHVLSAVGLFGAGVAVLFIASYSGHAYYDLYPRNTAFIFMGVCTIIGALVARRGNMVSIAVLSTIGGNLAPVLLSEGQPQLAGFLIYLLMLQVTSLTLAFQGAGPKWWNLRSLSLITTCLQMAAVIDQSNQSLLLGSTLIFAALFQLELIVSAAKSRLNPQQAGATFSLFVTAAMTAAVLHLQQDASQMVRLSWTLGFAAFAGAICLFGLRLANKTLSLRALCHGYALQSLGLIIVAVPLAFSGIWIPAAWGGLAIALAALSWLLDMPDARYAAPIIWALAVGDLVFWMSGFNDQHRDRAIGLSITGFDFPQYLLMSWLLAMQGQIVAKLMKSSRNQTASLNAHFFAKALSVTASALWLDAAFTGLSPVIATSCVLTYAGLLGIFDLLEVELNFLLQATVLEVAAALKWAFIDLLAHRMEYPVRSESILFSVHGLAGAVLLITLLIILARARATVLSNSHSKRLAWVLTATLVGVLFWMGTFTLDQAFLNLRFGANPIFTDPERAEQVALSIFWSLFAIASVVAGLVRRTAALRYVGLSLFAITLVKVVTIDLTQVSTGYRILSFIGLGLLLLSTSVIYGKLSPVILVGEDRESRGIDR